MSSDQGDNAIMSRDLVHHDGPTRLHGRFFWVRDTPRPGILLIHGGAGLDDHAREQARRYAALGYAVLAGDLYGDGVTGDRERTMATVTAMRDDPDRLVRRAEAALAALIACPETGPRRAAVGFCFGGMAALTLARAGADLTAAVSVHGSIATTRPAAPGTVRARVLACHGAADPHVPMTDVVAFTEEMGHAGADWQLAVYGGAQHGFTHRQAVPGAVPGVAYDRLADERSFAAIGAFLADALGG
jgi:dienelactone hydrolase